MNDHLPLYHCHKYVRAMKIGEIARTSQPPAFSGVLCKGSVALGTACGQCQRCKWEIEEGPKGTFLLESRDQQASVEVTRAYIDKHSPQVGGYFVQYQDGYQSWSPAAAFEGGYTLVPGGSISLLPPHQQRVIDEKDALDTKRVALGKFLNGAIFASLDAAERVRLESQAAVMDSYSAILGERISHFPKQPPIAKSAAAGSHTF